MLFTTWLISFNKKVKVQFRIKEINKQKENKSVVNCDIMWIFLFGLLGLLSYFWCVFIALAMFEVKIFNFNFKFQREAFGILLWTFRLTLMNMVHNNIHTFFSNLTEKKVQFQKTRKLLLQLLNA